MKAEYKKFVSEVRDMVSKHATVDSIHFSYAGVLKGQKHDGETRQVHVHYSEAGNKGTFELHVPESAGTEAEIKKLFSIN